MIPRRPMPHATLLHPACALVAAALLLGAGSGLAQAVSADSAARAASIAQPVILPDEPPSVEQLIERGRLALLGSDFAGALQAYRSAAAAGSARALGGIAELYEHGLGIGRNEAEATVLYRRAIAGGDIESRARLGLLLVQGAVASLAATSAANAAPAAGAAVAARSVRPGASAPAPASVSPLQEGLALIRESAAAGNAFGEYALGLLQLDGLVVPRDDYRALRLIESAARKDLPVAQSLLGRLYADGRAVEKHESMAIALLGEAARQGDVAAQGRLGQLYRDGHGAERDEVEAAYWFEKAAERGDAQAMLNLGLLLLEGRELRQDVARAVSLIRDAAQLGHAAAQYHYGVFLLEGRGVPQDRAQGEQWIRDAAARGFADAKHFLEIAKK